MLDQGWLCLLNFELFIFIVIVIFFYLHLQEAKLKYVVQQTLHFLTAAVLFWLLWWEWWQQFTAFKMATTAKSIWEQKAQICVILKDCDVWWTRSVSTWIFTINPVTIMEKMSKEKHVECTFSTKILYIWPSIFAMSLFTITSNN